VAPCSNDSMRETKSERKGREQNIIADDNGKETRQFFCLGILGAPGGPLVLASALPPSTLKFCPCRFGSVVCSSRVDRELMGVIDRLMNLELEVVGKALKWGLVPRTSASQN
jgi:hypothetical protein